MNNLTDYELTVLNAFALNTVDDLRQGAALNAAAEFLVEGGYMGKDGNLHDKGHSALGTKSPMKTATPSPPNLSRGVEKLGKFGHHPDPAVDFCIEIEAIEGYHFDASHGIGKPGEPARQIDDAFRNRIETAMRFRVGGDLNAIAAKTTLRTIDAAVTPAPAERAEASAVHDAADCAQKIDGVLRKLEALRIAFDMRGANATTILRAVNTLSTMRNSLIAALAAPPAPAELVEGCASRRAGRDGGNEAKDCGWPFCGCDDQADKVIDAIYESGFAIVERAAPSERSGVDIEAEIERVVQSVNEWDDRTSPDEYPEHLLITSEELSDILRNFAATLKGSTDE